MARLTTCKSCGKKLSPEEKHIHNSKSYCVDCFTSIERESNEYKSLIDFICKNYDIEKPTGFMLKQIKELKNEYNYSYAAMSYTLWYCKEVLGKQLLEKYGVSLIKHYYCEAKDYYSQQEKSKEQMEKLNDVEIKTKRIVRKKSNQDDKNNSLVNLGDLLKGGDTY